MNTTRTAAAMTMCAALVVARTVAAPSQTSAPAAFELTVILQFHFDDKPKRRL